MNSDSTKESPSQDESSAVQIHWIKSSIFRVIHADGAIGGITPRGLMQMSIYSERGAIPRLSQREIVGDSLSPEEIVESRGGVVREVETTVFMTEQTARELHQWLERRLKDFEELRKKAGDDRSK